MKTVLVTGASGFVGSHIVPLLAARGYDVLGTYLHDHEPRDPAARWRRWDLADTQSLAQILAEAKPRFVIHLASPSHVPTADNDPEGTVDAILNASVRFCRALESSTVERVLYTSSAEVYGPPRDENIAVDELHATEPRSMYGICKLAAGLWFQQRLRDRVVILRPFNQIGPRQSPRFAVSSFAHQIADIKKGKQSSTLKVGNVDVVRDWTDVRESAAAHIEALEKCEAGHVYNLCSGRGTSLRKLVDTMAHAAGIEVQLEVDPARLRQGETLRFVGDGGKLLQATGWSAKNSPETAAVAALHAALES